MRPRRLRVGLAPWQTGCPRPPGTGSCILTSISNSRDILRLPLSNISLSLSERDSSTELYHNELLDFHFEKSEGRELTITAKFFNWGKIARSTRTHHEHHVIPAEARFHAEDGLGDGGEETEVGADEGALEEVWHVEGEEVGVERHQLEGEVAGVHHLGQALLLDEGAEGGQALNGGRGRDSQQ